ncbi:MAG: hypothetical protein JNM97_21225 [Rhodoferax sp.]|nr:hypothetical protein [Rhodoferax sp.]
MNPDRRPIVPPQPLQGVIMVFRWSAHLATCILAASSSLALGQSIPIGRSSVSLPEPGRWTSSGLQANDPGYSGDSSGTIPMDGKRLVFTATPGGTRAVILARVTKAGIAGTSMSWGNDCNGVTAGPYLYKRDRSTTIDVDCLIVLAVGLPGVFLDQVPTLKKDLEGVVPQGPGFYYIEYSSSIGSGGYLFTQVLLSPDFTGLEGVPVEHQTRMPASVIAWAGEFAKNSRPAISSLSGSWTVPPLNFSRK